MTPQPSLIDNFNYMVEDAMFRAEALPEQKEPLSALLYLCYRNVQMRQGNRLPLKKLPEIISGD